MEVSWFYVNEKIHTGEDKDINVQIKNVGWCWTWGEQINHMFWNQQFFFSPIKQNYSYL